jgi:hypothetical protein
MFTFHTSDGAEVHVSDDVARKFNIIDDFSGDDIYPLPNVSEKILKNICSFLSHGTPVPKDDLINTCLASDYLFCQEALDHCAKAIADSLKGLSALEIRRAYSGRIGEAIDWRKKN